MLLTVISYFLVWPFIEFDPDKVRFSGFGYVRKECGQLPNLTPSLRQYVVNFEINNARACRSWYNGKFNGYTVALENVELFERGGSKSIGVTIPVNRRGEVVSPVSASDPVTLVLLLTIVPVVLILLRGRTPGKLLMKLQLTPAKGLLGRVFAREAIKWSPLIIMTLGAYATSPANLGAAPNAFSPVMLGLTAVMVLAILFVWLLPLIRWRGAMSYDRLLGLSVLGPRPA